MFSEKEQNIYKIDPGWWFHMFLYFHSWGYDPILTSIFLKLVETIPPSPHRFHMTFSDEVFHQFFTIFSTFTPLQLIGKGKTHENPKNPMLGLFVGGLFRSPEKSTWFVSRKIINQANPRGVGFQPLGDSGVLCFEP